MSEKSTPPLRTRWVGQLRILVGLLTLMWATIFILSLSRHGPGWPVWGFLVLINGFQFARTFRMGVYLSGERLRVANMLRTSKLNLGSVRCFGLARRLPIPFSTPTGYVDLVSGRRIWIESIGTPKREAQGLIDHLNAMTQQARSDA